MIYKNVEIHNIGALLDGEEKGCVKWLRVPENVYESLATDQGKRMSENMTGVELRFVMESDTVTLKIRTRGKHGIFHVYRGSIQGGFEDHENDKIFTNEIEEYVIKKSANLPVLKKMTEDFNQPFSPEVVRVIFDKGGVEIADIIGDVRPPKKEELPDKTFIAYGSSITHGSNSIDMSHSWVSVLAHNLKMDCINKGMAGSCLMEPEMIEYIAKMGENSEWDMAVLELGINALGWEKEKIITRVTNTITQIAGRNPDKKIFVISPFYSYDDYKNEGHSKKWRTLIEQIVNELNYSNVTYINGLDMLGDMSLMSADEVHPNIYGVAQIAERLEKVIKENM